MRTCLPTRYFASTASYSALAPLCFESATHSSRLPSNLPVSFTAAEPTDPARGSLGIPACPVGRLDSPQATSNPHTSTALTA